MADKKDEDEMTNKSVAPGRRRKKHIPSVDYLLKHGDPDTAHLPKTWVQMIGYPLVLALTFAVSLLIFHHAPHENARPRKKYTLPGVKRMAFFDRDARAAKIKIEKEQEMPTEL